MKKLIVLIVTTFLILTHSLGQGTNNTTTKDTTVNLPKPAAKEVAKDLLRGDSAISELEQTKRLLNEEKIKSNAKDSIISKKDQEIGIYKEKEKNWQGIIDLKDNQLDLEQEVSKKLAADLRKVKRKKTFMEIFGTALIGGLIYLNVTK